VVLPHLPPVPLPRPDASDDAPWGCSTQVVGDDLVLFLVGDVDLDMAVRLELGPRALCPDGHRLVVDTSGVRFIDSTGLNLLLMLRRTHPGMALRDPSRPVRDLLELTNVGSVMAVEGALR
jgi:anti-anti-sigma factor